MGSKAKAKQQLTPEEIREKYPDVSWVGERRNDHLQFVGDHVEPDKYVWSTAEYPDQIERAIARGGEVVDVIAQELDVRCVGIPPGGKVVYIRHPREVADEQHRQKVEANKRMWRTIKRGRFGGQGRIDPIQHGGSTIAPNIDSSVRGGAAGRALAEAD